MAQATQRRFKPVSLASPSLYVRSCRRDERGLPILERRIDNSMHFGRTDRPGQATCALYLAPAPIASESRPLVPSASGWSRFTAIGAWAPWLQVDHVPGGRRRRTAICLFGAVALVAGIVPFLGFSIQAVAAQTRRAGRDSSPAAAGSERGCAIYSNGQDEGSGARCGGTNYVTNQYVTHVKTGREWQCTELVNRLYLTRGWTRSFRSGNGAKAPWS